MPDPVFGSVPHPPYRKLLVNKDGPGNGYSAVPPRRIVGTCVHATWGYGTPGFYQQFFGWSLVNGVKVYGERHADALVDYYVDRSGEIAMLNEPEGTRSPWANGGSDGLEGDGPAFVAALGVGAINDRLVSIETEGKDEGLAAPQMAGLAALVAYWHDRARVPADAFPANPNVGCVTQMQHWEFATKDCPFAGVRAQTDEYQAAAREIMRRHQAAPDPNAALAARFGTLTREFEDGTTQDYRYDPAGLISLAWAARIRDEGVPVAEAPRPLRWWSLAAGGRAFEVVAFEGSWTLRRLSARSGWVWEA